MITRFEKEQAVQALRALANNVSYEGGHIDMYQVNQICALVAKAAGVPPPYFSEWEGAGRWLTLMLLSRAISEFQE